MHQGLIRHLLGDADKSDQVPILMELMFWSGENRQQVRKISGSDIEHEEI